MHYAISDVHAHTKTFEKFLSGLDQDDHVFFLGDAIDKGDGSLEVLKRIMKDERFTFIMGNHEYMLYLYLYYLKKTDETEEDENISDEQYSMYNSLAMDAFSVYVMNDGWRTIEAYSEENIETQNEIFDFLSHLPLQVEITINNKEFVLAHAMPTLSCDKIKDGVLYFDQFDMNNQNEYEHEKFLWDREFFKIYDNKIVVTGHNIVQSFFGTHMPYSDGKYAFVADKEDWFKCIEPGKWYDIDCGMAMRDPALSKLGILRLDDLAIKIENNHDSEDTNKEDMSTTQS